jgi:integrase
MDMQKSATLNRTPKRARRRRYQAGSLQKRKNGKHWVWIGFWWEGDSRPCKTLGKCAEMSKGDALAALADLLKPLNAEAIKPVERRWTLTELVDEGYLPYSRRKWKDSTAETTEDRIQYHIVRDLGKLAIRDITRDMLQRYLERKTKDGLSHSVVHHLRWDLRAIFRFAFQDGLVDLNAGESLFTPGIPGPKSRNVLNAEQVQQILEVLDLREQLAVRLAIFSGMRPGEIIALQWKNVHDDHVAIEQRIYRGKLDRPKTTRSKRKAALSPSTQAALALWKTKSYGENPEGWVFPSETLVTPIGRDNIWRRAIEPKLREIKLGWASFQVMRRTHATLSRKAGIDPKLVADQLGHGLGVNLDVYTIADLEQRLAAVNTLEQSLVSTAIH